MTEKLKPCPFCGEKADVHTLTSLYDVKQVFCTDCGATNTLWSEDAIKQWNERKQRKRRKKREIKSCPLCGAKALAYEGYDGDWSVQCMKCSLTSPYKLTREEAIEAWNRRADDD